MNNNLSLGKPTEYSNKYSSEILDSIPRAQNRDSLNQTLVKKMYGWDIWQAYELSWLNSKDKPQVALARFIVNASSKHIFESKSCKLYLNSFNQTKFDSIEQVRQTIINDLSAITQVAVDVELYQPNDNTFVEVNILPGDCIDGLDINVDAFQVQADLLTVDANAKRVDETLHSHLLKSNCLITNQPDWGSVIIDYHGQPIDHEGLLKYIISFREHNEFHEHCVERIFCDIVQRCQPEALTVQALYTRRGGIDINPIRSTDPKIQARRLRINRQ